MALLDLIQNVAGELGLKSVSSVYGSADNQVNQLYRLLCRGALELRSKQQWPELTKEGTITIVGAQDAYSFPLDFDRQVFQTQWDRSNRLALVGPMSAQEWQAIKSGLIASPAQRRFRVKGYKTNSFYIDPTPATGDAGQTLYYEYQTLNLWLPLVWSAGASFSAGAYCSYDGNIYSTTSGGTTGVTPPTHTSSSASDGGVTWMFSGVPYEKPLADTDTSILDQRLMELETKWRFMEANRFQYTEYKAEAEAAAMREISTKESAPTLVLHRRRGPSWLLRDEDLPEGNFNQ